MARRPLIGGSSYLRGGAGQASTEVATGAQAKLANLFTEAFGSEKSATGFGAWEDWDLSASIPAGASIAFVTMKLTSAGSLIGVRKDSSSGDRRIAPATSTEFITWPVALPTTRIIQIYIGDATTAGTFRLMGYL